MQSTGHVSLKPWIWGAVVGSIVTMIAGFGWGGWMTTAKANQVAIERSDAAVTSALVPICLAQHKNDVARAKQVGQLKAMTSSYEQTEFVMKTGWATFPGKEEPNRDVAQACAAARVDVARAK